MRRTTWLWSMAVLVGCLLSISLARSRIVAVYSNNPSCVDWVVYRARQLTWEPGIQADAYQWILYALATGHVLGTDPVPLSIAVWEKASEETGQQCEEANRDFGHVAFVESVNTDGTFNVTEFNWGDCSGSNDNPCNRPDVENAECIWFIHNPVLLGGPELASNVEVSEYDVHPGLTEAEIQFSVLNTSPNETLDPSFWIVGGGIGEWGLWWVSSNADFVTCDGCDDPIPPGETGGISFHINLEGWFSDSGWDGAYYVEYIRFEDWGGRYQLNNSGGYTLGQCFNVCYNCLQGTQSTQRIEALESGSCPDYCSGSPTPADPKQCSDLTICPSNPQVDETVTFSFNVCNDGGQSVTFQNIGPQGHGPPDGQGGLWNVFAHDITVGAGQTVSVSASRSFEWEGTWCIEHVPTQDQDGNWHDLPANGYVQAQCFDVSSSSSPADLRQASDLQVWPAYPMVDQEVTFSYAVKNYGGESITIDTIIPQGHAYDDGQQTGLWNVPSHNITVGPGETVSITARRSFEWEATWCIEHIPVLDQDGVWFDLPSNGYRQTQCFNVGSGSPGELRQASDLQFSPESPHVGEQVHFWFIARNAGGQVVTFTQIGPWGYGPEHTYWDANSHGHHALNPGEAYTINGYRTFAEGGVWTVDGIHYQLLDDPEPRGYYDLPSDGYAAAGIEINIVEPTPTPTPPPIDTPTVSPHDTPTPTPTPGGGLATPTAVPITVTPVTPQPTAIPTPCTPLFEVGDFDCDCTITAADIMQVASRWGCQVGDDCYDELYDLDDDGDIDIVDIMLVAAHWGETCE